MEKSIHLLSFALFFLSSQRELFAQSGIDKKGDLVWYTDMLKANEASRLSGKPIFGLFTGSDWCVWCHKLERDVFAKPDFIKWAQKNVILVELDFPRKKQLAPELAQQNNGLQQTFQVQGFPTVWMFYLSKDAASNKFNISALGSLGYPNDPEPGKEEVKFLKDANDILSKNKAKGAP